MWHSSGSFELCGPLCDSSVFLPVHSALCTALLLRCASQLLAPQLAFEPPLSHQAARLPLLQALVVLEIGVRKQRLASRLAEVSHSGHGSLRRTLKERLLHIKQHVAVLVACKLALESPQVALATARILLPGDVLDFYKAKVVGLIQVPQCSAQDGFQLQSVQSSIAYTYYVSSSPLKVFD